MLKIDGFDSALIGIATVWQKSESGGASRVDTLIYSGDSIIATLMHESGLSYEEAEEYVSFNIEGAYRRGDHSDHRLVLQHGTGRDDP